MCASNPPSPNNVCIQNWNTLPRCGFSRKSSGFTTTPYQCRLRISATPSPILTSPLMMLLLLLLASIWQVSEGVSEYLYQWLHQYLSHCTVQYYCTYITTPIHQSTNPPISKNASKPILPHHTFSLCLFVCLFVCLFCFRTSHFYSVSTLGLVIIDLLHRVRTQFHFGTPCEIGAWEWFIIITVPPYDILYGVQLTAWLANPYFSYIPLDY